MELRYLTGSSDVGDTFASQVRYSIIGGDPDGIFSIRKKTGLVFTTVSLDFEGSAEYTLTIEAADAGDEVLSSTIQLVITVLDRNDNSPVFDPTSVRCSYF